MDGTASARDTPLGDSSVSRGGFSPRRVGRGSALQVVKHGFGPLGMQPGFGTSSILGAEGLAVVAVHGKHRHLMLPLQAKVAVGSDRNGRRV